MADAPDADIPDAHTGAHPSAADGATEGYRDALETYADLLDGQEADADAVRQLERRIADHLVDGATPAEPTPAPHPAPHPAPGAKPEG